jgi:hypothetical protein
MKKQYFLILLFTFFYKISFAQTIIEVAENTLKIGALDEQVFYYGFAEGDQMIFNFEELSGKELKEIEIIEMPTSSKFTDYKSLKIINKTLNIQNNGIYKFRFYNSSLGKRICKIKIQRVPSSESTKKFNSNVFWKTIRDTTYTPTVEKYLEKSENIAKEIYSANPQISSTTAFNGNKNYQIIDFDLPENTVSWSFYIGTGNEGKKEFDNARNNFTDQATSSFSTLSTYGPMAALALTGMSYFSKVKGEDNVKYWFLSDQNSVQLFNAGQQFYTYKSGDVINEASQMKTPLTGKIYLALMNDNTIDPITLTIKVTAIQQIDYWKTRTIQVMNVAEWQEPYLMN